MDFQAFVPDKPTRRGEFEVTCIFQTKEICSPRSSKDVILLLGSTLAMFDLGRCIFAESISRNALWDLLMWSNDSKGLQRSWCLLRCLVSARALSKCVTDTSHLPRWISCPPYSTGAPSLNRITYSKDFKESSVVRWPLV